MLGFNVEDAVALQRQIVKFIEDVESDWTSVKAQWEYLKDCWCDRQYDQFEQDFMRLASCYEQALHECHEYFAFLQRKIDEAKAVPTIGERFEQFAAVISALSSLTAIGSPPVQTDSPNPPIICSVQTVPSQSDPFSSDKAPPTQQELAAQKFEAQKPSFTRPMSLSDQVEEIFQSNTDAKRERLRRDADISATNSSQPKATGSS